MLFTSQPEERKPVTKLTNTLKKTTSKIKKKNPANLLSKTFL